MLLSSIASCYSLYSHFLFWEKQIYKQECIKILLVLTLFVLLLVLVKFEFPATGTENFAINTGISIPLLSTIGNFFNHKSFRFSYFDSYYKPMMTSLKDVSLWWDFTNGFWQLSSFFGIFWPNNFIFIVVLFISNFRLVLVSLFGCKIMIHFSGHYPNYFLNSFFSFLIYIEKFCQFFSFLTWKL